MVITSSTSSTDLPPSALAAPRRTANAPCTLRRRARAETIAPWLGIGVSASALEPFAFASHAYERFHLLMPLYLCRVWTGEVRPMEGQRIQWSALAGLNSLPMPPADVPLVAALQREGALQS